MDTKRLFVEGVFALNVHTNECSNAYHKCNTMYALFLVSAKTLGMVVF